MSYLPKRRASLTQTLFSHQLDYTAGIIPVTHVDSALDKLPSTFDHKRLNGIAARAYRHYDAERMHGLPVGVQIIGRRLEEEKVLAVMKRVENALGENKYKLFDPKLLNNVVD